MQWEEIRRRYPRQWLLVEAIGAHSMEGRRIVDDLAVLETFGDPATAMKRYQEIHRWSPLRELYVLHSDRETLDIVEAHWLGLRTACPPS
jgi:hypothetical protein